MPRKKANKSVGSTEEYVTRPISTLIHLAVWLTGILVSLAVGFGMIDNGPLNQVIPIISYIGNGIIMTVAGWIVVVLTLLSLILAVLHKL